MNLRGVFLAFLVFLLLSSPAFSFYESGPLEMRGFAELSTTATTDQQTGNKIEGTGAAQARLLVDYNRADRIALEGHLLTTYALNEEASLLETRLLIDRFNIRWSDGPVHLTLGRQPINLATVFYFTPNDFFAPFSPERFFRVYKPGVDAARMDLGTDSLSQLAFIGVWNDPNESPVSETESLLARLSTDRFGFEWVGLAGEVSDRSIFGGGFAGEPWEGWGARAEGHYARPKSNDSYAKMAIDLEHRFPNGFNLRVEQYYNGERDRRAFFSSKDYTAIGWGYPFTPLLSLEGLFFRNGADAGSFAALHAVYSVSDETEFSLTMGIPIHDEAGPFGRLPYTLAMAVRSYF